MKTNVKPHLSINDLVAKLAAADSVPEICGLLYNGEQDLRPDPARVDYPRKQPIEDPVQCDRAIQLLAIITQVAQFYRRMDGQTVLSHEACKCLLRAFHADSSAYFSHALAFNTWLDVLSTIRIGANYVVKPYDQYVAEFCERLAAWSTGIYDFNWHLNDPVRVAVKQDIGNLLVDLRQYQTLVKYRMVSAIPYLESKVFGSDPPWNIGLWRDALVDARPPKDEEGPKALLILWAMNNQLTLTDQ